MREHSHLHDGERLLCAVQPSPGFLLSSLVSGLRDGIVVGGLLSGLLAVGLWAATGQAMALWLLIPGILLATALCCWLRILAWKGAMLRVTTERMLIDAPSGGYGTSLVTVRWDQYQESSSSSGGLFDMPFGARSLSVRYGTADTQRVATFPSLRHGKDLKHYLDKVDSAVRRKALQELRPFVAKPRGQRDVPTTDSE